MADISASDVMKLREMTKLPMMKCKQALSEAAGDVEKAIEILKSQLGKLMLDRSANATSEGRVFMANTPDGSLYAMVEIQCESPPVASSESLSKFGEAAVGQLLNGPGASSPGELLAQQAPGESRTLKEMFEELLLQIREKMVVARVKRVAGPVGGYVHHDGKTAVLFEATGTNLKAPVLRDVAMHIAALKPVVARVAQLDAAAVDAERARLTAEARATGKPENIIGKIVEGKLKLYYRDDAGVLEEQLFAKDDSKTVNQVLAEAGLKVKDYTLWVVGA